MKKISDYFKGVPLKVKYDNGYNIIINREDLYNVIKQVQIDTIKEAVQTCADNAATVHNEEFLNELSPGLKSNDLIYKPSILEVADKLIEEL